MTLFKQDRFLLLFLLGWAGLALAALFLRPLWPVDETRYVAVAWEMWQRGDFLVPYLNGAPYSQKPPLLFWLIQAGWALFGVNEWWPRLVSPLLALLSIPLMVQLARRLWPDTADLALNAVWIYAGALLFGVLYTLVGFDGLLVCSTLIGMLGIARAAQGELRRGMLWLGVGIGLGVLSKGPVILLHLLPAAVFAPGWSPAVRGAKARWYRALLGAFGLGALLALLWAVPAAYVGGAAYRNAIFWGQTAGRMTSSFAHRAPLWWYLPLLPALLFPWLVWPSLWRGLRGLRSEKNDSSLRFLFAWIVPVFIGFSLISGKQERYLLPLLPAFALLSAYALQRMRGIAGRFDLLLPALGFSLFSGGWVYAMTHPQRLGSALANAHLPFWPALVFAAIAVAFVFAGHTSLRVRLRLLAGSMLVLMFVIYWSVIPLVASFSDPRPFAQHLSSLQARGIALAHWGKYHGQFDFSGRLKPIMEINSYDGLNDWLRHNPQGRILVYQEQATSAVASRPEFEQRFRGGYMQVWDARRYYLAHVPRRPSMP